MMKVQRGEQVGDKKRIRRVKAMIDRKVMLNDREGRREKVALAINMIYVAALLICAHLLQNTQGLWSPLTSTQCVFFYLANGHCERFSGRERKPAFQY